MKLSVLAIAVAPIASTQDVAESAQPPDGTVLEVVAASTDRPSPFEVLPLGFLRLDSGVVAGFLRGPKRESRLALWKEDAKGEWSAMPDPIAGFQLPPALVVAGGRLLAIGNRSDEVGSRSSVGPIVALAVEPGATSEPIVVAEPAGPSGRTQLIAARATGRTVHVFYVLSHRAGGDSDLYHRRSPDAGATWEDPGLVARAPMFDDTGQQRVLLWSENEFGLFGTERDRQPRFYRTTNGGDSWVAEPVELADEFETTSPRAPFAAAQGPEWDGLAYMVKLDRARARWAFARSEDRGRTWSRGEPVTPEFEPEDVVALTTVLASGDHVALAWADIDGEWFEGEYEMRLATSGDRGRTWTTVAEPTLPGRVVGAQLGIDSERARFLYATARWNPDDNSTTLRIRTVDPR